MGAVVPRFDRTKGDASPSGPQTIEPIANCLCYGVAVLNVVERKKTAIGQRLTVERFDLDRNDQHSSTKALLVTTLSLGRGEGHRLGSGAPSGDQPAARMVFGSKMRSAASSWRCSN